MSRTIHGELIAYVTEYSSIRPEDLLSMDAADLARSLTYSSANMTTWTKVGKATVTVELQGVKEIIAGQVDALRAQAKQVQAEAQKKVTDIERQIQTLMAISYEPESQA